MSFIVHANSKRLIWARQRLSRFFKTHNKAVNDLTGNDADDRTSLYLEKTAITLEIDDNNSHTCIKSCTSLRANYAVCILNSSQHSFEAPKDAFVTQTFKRRDPL